MSGSTPSAQASRRRKEACADALAPLRGQLRVCIQCGTCTGSCPNAWAMDISPRRMWRLVICGQEAKVWESAAFALCSACYTCMLRCPRDIPLTEIMAGLKRIAFRQNLPAFRGSARFYQSFMAVVAQSGRVDETRFMTRYLLAARSPGKAVRFTPLGMKLLRKGKIGIRRHPPRGVQSLGRILARVRELEE